MSTNNLKQVRKRLGLKQRELAAAIGVSKGNISHYECQRQLLPPTVAQSVIALAALHGLQISYDDIYGSTPSIASTKENLPDANHRHQ